MRTTLNIDDDLLAELKKRAGDTAMTTVVNETLRRGLSATESERQQEVKQFTQRTFKLGRHLIDMDKALSIADEWDDLERLRRMRDDAVTDESR